MLSEFNVLIGLDEILIVLTIQRQGPRQYDHTTHFFYDLTHEIYITLIPAI